MAPARGGHGRAEGSAWNCRHPPRDDHDRPRPHGSEREAPDDDGIGVLPPVRDTARGRDAVLRQLRKGRFCPDGGRLGHPNGSTVMECTGPTQHALSGAAGPTGMAGVTGPAVSPVVPRGPVRRRSVPRSSVPRSSVPRSSVPRSLRTAASPIQHAANRGWSWPGSPAGRRRHRRSGPERQQGLGRSGAKLVGGLLHSGAFARANADGCHQPGCDDRARAHSNSDTGRCHAHSQVRDAHSQIGRAHV